MNNFNHLSYYFSPPVIIDSAADFSVFESENSENDSEVLLSDGSGLI
jgi:hypothetical protein